MQIALLFHANIVAWPSFLNLPIWYASWLQPNCLCSTASIKQRPSPKMKLSQLPLLPTVLLSTLTSLVSSASPSAAFPNSITLSYEPVLDSSSVKPLATIFYDPKTLKSSLSSWAPPVVDAQSTTPEPASSKLFRILLPNGSSTLASLATFNSSLTQTISLHLSPNDGTVFSASVSATAALPPPRSSKSKSKSKSKTKSSSKAKSKSKAQPAPAAEDFANVHIEIITPTPGPMPKLNSRKPTVIGPDGKEAPAEGEVPEKSFFQKYWWVFLLLTVVAMAGSGDK
jgi:hypothetical protein